MSATPSANGVERTLAALVSGHEAECERAGRRLHDDIGQILIAVGMQLEALRMDAETTPGMPDRLRNLQQAIEEAMAKTRELSMDLNPSVVERAGLRFALDQLAENSANDLTIHFEPGIYLPREPAKMFFRVAEYGTGPAARAAGASKVQVHVKDQNGTFVLEVRHFGPFSVPSGDHEEERRVAWLLLDNHARRLGLQVEVETASGQGTIIKTRYLNSYHSKE